MNKVLCFGELMLRINVDEAGEWIQRQQFPFYIGGAELNVATALHTWDVPVTYVTSLPDNYLGDGILDSVAQRGVGVNHVFRSGEKVGMYFLKVGGDLKNGGVIYDRQGSSFSQLRRGQLNWDAIFQGVSHFHFSAISPALSEQAADLCEEALLEAVKRNLIISVDLNFRQSLWKYTDSPVLIMAKLVKHCDIVMGNVWAAQHLLNIPLGKDLNEGSSQSDCRSVAFSSAQELSRRFPKCRQVAYTYRFKKEGGVRYFSCLFSEGDLHTSPTYSSEQLVDPVGSGDCYMAALLFGLYHQQPSQQIVDFASAAAFSKLFVRGDSTNLTIQEIKDKVSEYLVLT